MVNKKEIENNALFWQKIDSLFLASKVIIDRPKGSSHPVYNQMVYPVDYGYLQDTFSMDHDGIDVFVGSSKPHLIDTIALAADILKKDIEVKIFYGCTSQEEDEILTFLNNSSFQKTILVRRGDSVPEWAND
ncbi:MAG: inorganic diphosphatase [Erysipelotrichaceae bacterium]